MFRWKVWMMLCAAAAWGDDGQRLLRLDHYVPVKSIAPSMKGQTAQVYVREVVHAGAGLRKGAGQRAPVVLFIHGAGTPAEVRQSPAEAEAYLGGHRADTQAGVTA